MKRQLTVLEVIVVVMIVVIVVGILLPPPTEHRGARAADAQNERQVALGALMYSGDYDEQMVPTINGRLSRLQNIADGHLTVNCPNPGTQDLESKDAAGGQRTDTWVLILTPYIKSMHLWVDPGRGDVHKYFVQGSNRPPSV